MRIATITNWAYGATVCLTLASGIIMLMALVGIISRTDLVRKLAEAIPSSPTTKAEDGQLHKAIWQEIKAQPWLRSAVINLSVKDGVVELYGAADSDAQRQAFRVLVENVPGVRSVQDKVGLLPKVAA